MKQNHLHSSVFESAMMAFATNDYERAIKLFTQVINEDANPVLSRLSRGAAYLKKDMLDSAWNDFNHAVTLDPNYARAYHMRGLVSEKKGDDAAALADFDRAIELDPEYGAAYYSRAALHTKRADPDKAYDDIQMVTHLGDRNMATYMNENNVWQTQHMRVEDAIETELQR